MGNIAVLAETVLEVVIVQPGEVMINRRLPRGTSCRSIPGEVEGFWIDYDSNSH